MKKSHYPNLKIIVFVGLAGSGKSTATDYLKEKKYPSVYFGGVIIRLMKERGIEITPENEKIFREQIRKERGNDVVAQEIIKEIHDLAAAGQHRIVADGLYTWTEYKLLKREFPGELLLVAVVAPKVLRHHRLTNRPIRPFTLEEANQRDWNEIENLEKGGPIAIADHFIYNSGSVETLHQALDALLQQDGFYE